MYQFYFNKKVINKTEVLKGREFASYLITGTA